MSEHERADQCPGCGNEIDPDTCWCGVAEADHNYYNDPHSFTPIGCTCGYAKTEGETDAGVEAE